MNFKVLKNVNLSTKPKKKITVDLEAQEKIINPHYITNAHSTHR